MMSLQCGTSVALYGGFSNTINPGVTAPGSWTFNTSLVSGSGGVSGSAMTIGVGNVPIRGEPGWSACALASCAASRSAQSPTSSHEPCLINHLLLRRNDSDPIRRDVKSEGSFHGGFCAGRTNLRNGQNSPRNPPQDELGSFPRNCDSERLTGADGLPPK